MSMLRDIAEFKSGSPQFRITELESSDEPSYFLYGQAELEGDRVGIVQNTASPRMIRTGDSVCTLEADDLVFSLMTGKAAIVKSVHRGYLFTQNFVRIVPSSKISSHYLAYLLNENHGIRKQLFVSQQGSVTMKFTVSQLQDLVLPELPPYEMQKIIGELYFNQLRLDELKKRRSTYETRLVLERLKGVSHG